jgi:glycosyltransferase involved in cell wall biosynthesis
LPAPRLLYLVTEDWYFLSHRLPMARAAREAGFDVTVATRVADGGADIAKEGFRLCPLSWQRGISSPGEIARSVAAVAGLLRAEKPDVVHNVALKPILIAGLARRLVPVRHVVNAVTGLGSTLIAREGESQPRLAGRLVAFALPRVLNMKGGVTVIQNDADADALGGLGADRLRMVRIRGSGVDLAQHQVLPEPEGPVTVGIAARMIEDKGIRPLIEAVRQVRASGIDLKLLLAGDTDADNPTAIPRSELDALAQEPGITWLGHVTDVRTLWARSHIAALPSRREGLPKALLEAAAAGRPLVATDVPGCREVAVEGVNARLVPVDDAAALATALSDLARDEGLRARLGAASRKMVESDMSADAVAAATVALYCKLLQA